MATIASVAISSRQASISSFSVKGSPTWTVGRLASASSSKSALAMVALPPLHTVADTMVAQGGEGDGAGWRAVAQ